MLSILKFIDILFMFYQYFLKKIKMIFLIEKIAFKNLYLFLDLTNNLIFVLNKCVNHYKKEKMKLVLINKKQVTNL